MRVKRMSHAEHEMYMLGLTLRKAVEGMKETDHPNWEWLVTKLEVAARANPNTAPVEPMIRHYLPDPDQQIPF